MGGRVRFEPTDIFYLTSLRCNERCTKCSHWKVRDHPDMVPPELVIEAVREVKSARELCIVGGEPLVYRQRVLTILRGIADLPIRTTIVTNGVLCGPEFVNQVRALKTHIVVSIDTLDPVRWRWVRGRDSMDVVLRNFDYIQQTLRPDQLSVQSVLSEETRDDVAAVGRWCADKGTYHSIQQYVQGGFDGSWTPITTSPPEPQPLLGPDIGPCVAADRNLSIMPDGSVFTCFQQPLMPNSARPIGRLGEVSIGDILDSAYTVSVLRRMRTCDLPCKVLRCNQ